MSTNTEPPLPSSCYVVVPAFNEAPRIGRTLENLLQVAQTVVVVDDGSADNTAEVALRYPVWLLRHPVNLGQGAAIQTGITFSLRQICRRVGSVWLLFLDVQLSPLLRFGDPGFCYSLGMAREREVGALVRSHFLDGVFPVTVEYYANPHFQPRSLF